jgi:hypothetical protein
MGAPNLDIDHYFSEDYEIARGKVIGAASGAGLDHEVIEYSKGLFVDVFYKHPEQRQGKNVFMSLSGVHGIEGFYGSAAQLRFLEEYAKDMVDEGVGVVVVHALNPWGFKNCRRVNENNQDGNRGFVDSVDELCVDDDSLVDGFNNFYPSLTPQEPRKNDFRERLMFCYNGIKDIIKYGMKELMRVLPVGQYHQDDSIMYGGRQIPRSTEILRKIVEEHSEGYETLVAFDKHTAFAPHNPNQGIETAIPRSVLRRSSFLTHHKEGTPEFQKVSEIFPDIASLTREGSGDTYKPKGHSLGYAEKHSRAQNFYGTWVEARTISSPLDYIPIIGKRLGDIWANLSVLEAFVVENQVYHHQNSDNLGVDEAVRRRFREAFLPSSQRWRRQVLKDIDDMWYGICQSVPRI